MSTPTKKVSMFVLALALAIATAPASWSAAAQSPDRDELVRKQLNKLDFITVFDSINYEITGDTVRLTGYVTKPWDKADAEQLVKKVDGVASVVNDIEVLPLSRFDDSIRINAYRTLFNRNSALTRYHIGSYAPIRIIVKNGHLTLEGYVGSEFDKRYAESLVRTVPNTFSITNNLKVG